MDDEHERHYGPQSGNLDRPQEGGIVVASTDDARCPGEGVVDIEATDKLTDAQIVAKVKEHFNIDH